MRDIRLNFGGMAPIDESGSLEKIHELEKKIKDLQAKCDAQEIELLEKDFIIYDLQQKLKKNRVGRPSKYEQYYDLIHELYKKLGTATKVSNELATMGIEISLRQVNNIIHMRLGNN